MGGQTTIPKTGTSFAQAKKRVLDKRAAKRKRMQALANASKARNAKKSPKTVPKKPAKATAQKTTKQKKSEFSPIKTQQLGPGFDGQEWLNQSINLINQVNPSGANNEIDPRVGKTSKRNRNRK